MKGAVDEIILGNWALSSGMDVKICTAKWDSTWQSPGPCITHNAKRIRDNIFSAAVCFRRLYGEV